MGRVVASSWKCDSDETNDRVKKKKRKKVLEEIRRNALAAKRNLRSRATDSTTSRSEFMKSLNEFAAKRQAIEDAVQSQDSLLNRPRIIKDQKFSKPLQTKGFFRGGIKGKQVTRSLNYDDEKLKDAVLHNDALQLMQSGGYSLNLPKESQSQPKTQDHISQQMKMEFAKILRSSSESISDIDDPVITEKIQSSPVLGGAISFQKKAHLLKVNSDVSSQKHSHFQNKESLPVQNVTKEDKCKRRLFEEENKTVNNRNTEYLSNNEHDNLDAVRFSPRKATPENVIFYTEHIPKKKVDKNMNNKQNDHKTDCVEPKLMQFYLETVQMGRKNFNGIFSDPVARIKATLKNTYINAFRDYEHRQKCSKSEQRLHSEGRSTVSTDSEIMLEPDSAIARTLKKNIDFHMKNEAENNCTIRNTNIENLEENEITVEGTTEHNPMKRKFVSSSRSERSDIEIPSSVRVNVDPVSVRVGSKLDSILPERQELIARYLKDVNTNNKHENEKTILNNENNKIKECNSHHFEKEKILISDNNERTYLVQKTTKHIPAILRKNRPSVDCVSKEKILFRIEKYPVSDEITNKVSKQELNFDDNLKSERTPDCGNVIPTQLMEAPKCKYTYMNAKYNQPSRINLPSIQDKRVHRNAVPERHLFVSPNNNKSFVLSQNLELSPIKRQLNLPQNKYDFHMCHLSQESSELENNCMSRMPSFGEIQERTNQLTLCSSQNCSQESSEQVHSSQERNFNLHPNFYYQQPESSNACMAWHNQPCVSFNEIPTSQSINNTYNRHSHNAMKFVETPSYIPNNNFQVRQPENYSLQRSEDSNCCLANDYQIYRKQNSQQFNQEPVMTHIPMQQQNIRQPIKFIAVEGNRLPQRRPVYSTNNDSYSHQHKMTISNQQYAQPYSRETSNQPCYTMSSVNFHPQELAQDSSDFEYANILQAKNMVPSNVQTLSSRNNEISRSNRTLVNFVPSSISEPNCIPQQSRSMHMTKNQRFMGQKVQMPMLSPLYPQVGYKHNHCNNNEGYRINDVYLQQQMNCNIHSKRP